MPASRPATMKLFVCISPMPENEVRVLAFVRQILNKQDQVHVRLRVHCREVPRKSSASLDPKVPCHTVVFLSPATFFAAGVVAAPAFYCSPSLSNHCLYTMNDPERLIAQMLAETDDGDQTITSRFFDGTASAYQVPSTSPSPSPPRSSAKRRPANHHARHLARSAANNANDASERRLSHAVRKGQMKAESDRNRDRNSGQNIVSPDSDLEANDQGLYPVRSIEILDEESIGDLTEATYGMTVSGGGSSPGPNYNGFRNQRMPHPTSHTSSPSPPLPASRYYQSQLDREAFSFSSKTSTGNLTEVDEEAELEEVPTAVVPATRSATSRPSSKSDPKRKSELKIRTKPVDRRRRCRLCCGLSMCCCLILLIAVGVILAGSATGFIKGVPFVDRIFPKNKNAAADPGSTENGDKKQESGNETAKAEGPKFL